MTSPNRNRCLPLTNTTPITPFVGHPGWQFHHVVDIVPTLLEITGLPAPVQIDGIAQKPLEGVSLAYTIDAAAGGLSAERGRGFKWRGPATGGGAAV